MQINYLFLHHFGGVGNDNNASTIGFDENVIERAHAARWPDFKGKLSGKHIGYNAIIWPNGAMTQYRYIGEETAAVKGYNTGAAHICLAGNRNKVGNSIVDPITPEMLHTMIQVCSGLLGFPVAKRFTLQTAPGVVLQIPKTNVLPHRARANTQCYGTGWADTYVIGEVLLWQNQHLSLLMQLVMMYQKLVALRRKNVLGSNEREDPESIPLQAII